MSHDFDDFLFILFIQLNCLYWPLMNSYVVHKGSAADLQVELIS